MAEPSRTWPWRVSLGLAALIVAWTLKGLYETWRQVQLTDLIFPGTTVQVNWSGIGLIALFGIVIPLTWLAVAWRKAFPRDSGRPSSPDRT